MSIRLWAIFLLGVSGALLLFAGCDRGKKSPSNVSSLSFSEPVKYVGDFACASCHQKIFKSHRATRHANTLRSVNEESMGTDLPPLGAMPKEGYPL